MVRTNVCRSIDARRGSSTFRAEPGGDIICRARTRPSSVQAAGGFRKTYVCRKIATGSGAAAICGGNTGTSTDDGRIAADFGEAQKEAWRTNHDGHAAIARSGVAFYAFGRTNGVAYGSGGGTRGRSAAAEGINRCGGASCSCYGGETRFDHGGNTIEIGAGAKEKAFQGNGTAIFSSG